MSSFVGLRWQRCLNTCTHLINSLHCASIIHQSVHTLCDYQHPTTTILHNELKWGNPRNTLLHYCGQASLHLTPLQHLLCVRMIKQSVSLQLHQEHVLEGSNFFGDAHLPSQRVTACRLVVCACPSKTICSCKSAMPSVVWTANRMKWQGIQGLLSYFTDAEIHCRCM